MLLACPNRNAPGSTTQGRFVVLHQPTSQLCRLHSQSHVSGTRPLFALADLVLHRLAFLEFLKGHTLNLGVMKPGLFTGGVDDAWNYCVIFCV